MSLSPEVYETVVRIVDQRVGEIKVTREDFDKLVRTVSELSTAVRELAEAQKRTEERIGSLASAVEVLAKAQEETRGGLTDLRVAVGSLTDTVGFSLEDVAKVVVPGWLQRHENIYVETLERRHIPIDHKYMIEVNLYGEGAKNSEKVIILGESKSRIFGGDVESFVMNMRDVERQMPGRKFLKLLFGFYVHPTAQEAAKKHDVRVIASYQR